MVKLIIEYNFQKPQKYQGYTYPTRYSIVSFDDINQISNDAIIEKLIEIEVDGAGFDLLKIQQINPSYLYT